MSPACPAIAACFRPRRRPGPCPAVRGPGGSGGVGAAAGVMGALQALEVLKEVAGIGTGLAGKILTYKALTAEFRTARLPCDPACPLCGNAPKILDLSGHG